MRRFALAFALLGTSLLACEPRVEPASQQAPTPAESQPVAPAPVEPTPDPTPVEPKPLDLVEGEVEGIHYAEAITGGAERDASLPMIVAIHGLGDSPENFAMLFAGFDRPARVILPRGLEPHEGGWSWFAFRARDPDVDALAKSIGEAADELAPAIAALAKQRPTTGKPIITGFSQGGMLTTMLAVEHGELLDHAISIGGWLPPPRWPKAKPAHAPTIVELHGDIDKAVAFGPTREAIEHLKSLGWPAELHGYPNMGHAIPPVMREEIETLLRSYIDPPPQP